MELGKYCNKMEKIKIENPLKLIDFAESNTIWTIKYRGEDRDVYKFGLQFDPNIVWDGYQIYILKKTKVIEDMYDDSKRHYFVDMVCEEMNGNRKQITNTIPLDDAMRVGKVLAHMLDGVAEMEGRL
jgi:phosphoserine aminotransferase